uniref:PHD-type domain-containing protein n=1 Tax=Globisporangium ultimum (strain ATCC 200006 / CBS 805.95 / DAOM BR144) TaxID=431595 RepID=K3WJK3_GLOUD
METRRDDGSSSDSSSGGSSSSSDTVLISKPLHQNHRKKLQAQLQQQLQQQEGGRAVAADAPSNVQPQGANESAKVDDICLVCEREGDLYLCTGPCVSAFHLRCLGINREPPAKETWMCPSCTSNVHVCFHCKRLGVSSSPEGSPAPTSGTPAASSVAHTEELRPVRKCRALSCGKFYHPECITNLPLARIAGSNKHFICPLHTCAACEQSGAKKESVRCMRCPVAYHTSCLPKSCAQNFPGKRIICPKHDASDRTVSPVVVVAAADAAADDKNAVSTKLSSQMLSMSDAEKQCSRDRRTDNDEDIKSEASLTTGGATSSNSKKLSKNSKREKKKKKKKRKKMKKHESKERSHDDDDDDADKDFPKGKKKASTRTDSDDDEDEDDGDPLSDTGAAIKREAASSDSITIPAIPASYSEAISPATSTFFESPGKIKARLDEALGQSDDELDSVESPVPQPKHEEGETAPEGAPVSSKHSVTQPTAVKPPSEDEGLSNVKREPQALTSITLADPAIVEQSRSLLSTIQPRPVLASTSRAEPDESGHSASDSFSASQSSGEKKKPKSERKIRRESLLSSSTDGKDLVRQSLFKDKDKSERRSSKKHELGDLSHQISGSPMSSGLKAPRGVEVEDSSLKISVSEGEDGDDEGPGGSSTPSSRRRASVGTPRGGAVDMASLARANKKKKKKKTKNEGDVSTDAKRDEKRSKKRGPDGEGEKTEVNAEEAKWVQCDSCKKWRTVPKDIDLNSMPERWYCKMNTWDSVYASCAVAEEVVDAASKKQKSGSHVKRSSGKIKVKQQPENSIPAASVLSDGEGSSHSSGSGSSSKKTAVEGVDTSTADEKGSKLSKKQESKAKKRKLKLKLKEKYREVKWVQCENAQCGKWRVVPSSIDFNLLPAVWYCHLNTWAPEIANCSAPNPPEVDTFLLKSQSKKGSSSARPTKKLKPTGESSSSATGPSSEISPAAQQLVAAITSDAPPKPVKSGKPPKGTSQIANQIHRIMLHLQHLVGLIVEAPLLVDNSMLVELPVRLSLRNLAFSHPVDFPRASRSVEEKGEK